jgi:hypothetical protein
MTLPSYKSIFLEGFHCLILGQVIVAGQGFKKAGGGETIHDRPFDFAQVQLDIQFCQGVIELFQCFQRAKVDLPQCTSGSRV